MDSGNLNYSYIQMSLEYHLCKIKAVVQPNFNSSYNEGDYHTSPGVGYNLVDIHVNK